MKDSTIVLVYLCVMLVSWVMIDKVLDMYFDNYGIQSKIQDELLIHGF